MDAFAASSGSLEDLLRCASHQAELQFDVQNTALVSAAQQLLRRRELRGPSIYHTHRTLFFKLITELRSTIASNHSFSSSSSSSRKRCEGLCNVLRLLSPLLESHATEFRGVVVDCIRALPVPVPEEAAVLVSELPTAFAAALPLDVRHMVWLHNAELFAAAVNGVLEKADSLAQEHAHALGSLHMEFSRDAALETLRKGVRALVEGLCEMVGAHSTLYSRLISILHIENHPSSSSSSLESSPEDVGACLLVRCMLRVEVLYVLSQQQTSRQAVEQDDCRALVVTLMSAMELANSPQLAAEGRVGVLSDSALLSLQGALSSLSSERGFVESKRRAVGMICAHPVVLDAMLSTLWGVMEDGMRRRALPSHKELQWKVSVVVDVLARGLDFLSFASMAHNTDSSDDNPKEKEHKERGPPRLDADYGLIVTRLLPLLQEMTMASETLLLARITPFDQETVAELSESRQAYCRNHVGFLEHRLSREIVLSFLVRRLQLGDLECVSDCEAWVTHAHGAFAAEEEQFPASLFSRGARDCLQRVVNGAQGEHVVFVPLLWDEKQPSMSHESISQTYSTATLSDSIGLPPFSGTSHGQTAKTEQDVSAAAADSSTAMDIAEDIY